MSLQDEYAEFCATHPDWNPTIEDAARNLYDMLHNALHGSEDDPIKITADQAYADRLTVFLEQLRRALEPL